MGHICTDRKPNVGWEWNAEVTLLISDMLLEQHLTIKSASEKSSWAAC